MSRTKQKRRIAGIQREETAEAEVKRTASQSQRLAQKLEKRQDLLRSISTASYVPQGDGRQDPLLQCACNCPECGEPMSLDAVFDGFTADPLDPNTKCPECFHRFIATLDVNIGAKFLALCAAQTRGQYRCLLDQGVLSKDNPITIFTAASHIAWNAYWHSPLKDDSTKSVPEKVFAFLNPDGLVCGNCKGAVFTIDAAQIPPTMACQECGESSVALSDEIFTHLKTLF